MAAEQTKGTIARTRFFREFNGVLSKPPGPSGIRQINELAVIGCDACGKAFMCFREEIPIRCPFCVVGNQYEPNELKDR